MPAQERNTIRQEKRRQRGRLTLAQQTSHALAAAQHIHRSGILSSTRIKKVAVYLDFDGELGTGPLIKILRAGGKQLFVPVIDEGAIGMSFSALPCSPEAGNNNRFGIHEPQANRGYVNQLDALIIPLTAFDRLGRRLGMGGGYYDRYLARTSMLALSRSNSPHRRCFERKHKRPVLIGFGHECQRLSKLGIQPEAWDINMDCVATEAGLHQSMHRRC